MPRATLFKTNRPKVFLRKGVLKIYSKFTGEHPCQKVISIKLQSSFIEITLRHGCSPVNLLYIFSTLSLRIPLEGCLYQEIYRIAEQVGSNHHRKCSLRKGVLRNFAKFARKHLRQSLFFNKVAGLRSATLLKKRHWHRSFAINFAKFLRTPFLQNTSR